MLLQKDLQKEKTRSRNYITNVNFCNMRVWGEWNVLQSTAAQSYRENNAMCIALSARASICFKSTTCIILTIKKHIHYISLPIVFNTIKPQRHHHAKCVQYSVTLILMNQRLCSISHKLIAMSLSYVNSIFVISVFKCKLQLFSSLLCMINYFCMLSLRNAWEFV